MEAFAIELAKVGASVWGSAGKADVRKSSVLSLTSGAQGGSAITSTGLGSAAERYRPGSGGARLPAFNSETCLDPGHPEFADGKDRVVLGGVGVEEQRIASVVD